jgi:hypothetical protein
VEEQSRWHNTLNAIEAEVARAEALLAFDANALSHDNLDANSAPGSHPAPLWPTSPGASWVAPTGLGLLPESMVGRARSLLARQSTAAAALRQRAARNKQHISVTNAILAPTEPAYLDLAG